MSNSVEQNRQAILVKLGILDTMLESAGKVHEDNLKAQEELFKKISTRKLVLMEELFGLLSSLS
jgi:hypothetical protein